MRYKSVKGITGPAQIGILLVFLGLGFILAGLAQKLIGLQMVPPGTGMTELPKALEKAMKDPAQVGNVRLLQVVGTLLLMFVPSVMFSWVVHGRNKFWLGFNPYLNAKQVLLGFVLIFAANIVAGPLADLSKSFVAGFPSLKETADAMEATYNEQVKAMSNLSSWREYFMALFIVAFFPAVFEEIFFRGALQNTLSKWWKQPLLAILVTSIIFSLIHLSIYLFLSRIVLGIVLGLLYERSKNIGINIIAHFLNNAVAVSQIFYFSMKGKEVSADELDPTMPWWVGVIALIGIVFLFRLFDQISAANKEKIALKEKLLIADNDPFGNIAH